jgi:hypothetical protein
MTVGVRRERFRDLLKCLVRPDDRRRSALDTGRFLVNQWIVLLPPGPE